MQKSAPDSLLDVRTVAARLGVSPYTVRAWLRLRRFDYVKLGRRVLVPESAVNRFIEANRVPAREGADAH